MIVKSLMSQDVSLLPASANLSQVVLLMREKAHSYVLIEEEGVPLGIITERDLVRVLDAQLQSPDENIGLLSVIKLMTRDPVCVVESTALLDALVLSRSRKLRHLPVVDTDGKLVGLVTHIDMVDAYISLVERQGELENVNQELQALSLEDPLLNIGNRRALDMELALAEAQSRRNKEPFALVMLDVDWFKRYNDHYGHPMGDKALQAVAGAIKACMRGSDRLYRYGGEELMLLMPNSGAQAAQAGADRARLAVEAYKLEHQESPLKVLTVSCGAAWGCGVEGGKLMDAADKALYKAKGHGRNQVFMADDFTS